MDPTSLPTDNLYKFLALAGLMLAGFARWLLWKFKEAEIKEVEGYEEILARAKARQDALRDATRSARAEVTSIMAAVAERPQSAVAYLEPVKKTLTQTDEFNAEISTIYVEMASIEARVMAQNRRLKRLRPTVRGLGAAMLFGAALSCVGFALWYFNAQWYTDRQTKADYEDHMAELAAKRAARGKAKP